MPGEGSISHMTPAIKSFLSLTSKEDFAIGMHVMKTEKKMGIQW